MLLTEGVSRASSLRIAAFNTISPRSAGNPTRWPRPVSLFHRCGESACTTAYGKSSRLPSEGCLGLRPGHDLPRSALHDAITANMRSSLCRLASANGESMQAGPSPPPRPPCFRSALGGQGRWATERRGLLSNSLVRAPNCGSVVRCHLCVPNSTHAMYTIVALGSYTMPPRLCARGPSSLLPSLVLAVRYVPPGSQPLLLVHPT